MNKLLKGRYSRSLRRGEEVKSIGPVSGNLEGGRPLASKRGRQKTDQVFHLFTLPCNALPGVGGLDKWRTRVLVVKSSGDRFSSHTQLRILWIGV